MSKKEEFTKKELNYISGDTYELREEYFTTKDLIYIKELKC